MIVRDCPQIIVSVLYLEFPPACLPDTPPASPHLPVTSLDTHYAGGGLNQPSVDVDGMEVAIVTEE